MRTRRLIAFILAVFLTVGLALSPVVTPAAANDMTLAMSDMAAMSDDMPCCPSEQKSKSCPDCPLVATCVIKTAQTGPAIAASMPLRHAIRLVHSLRDDVAADGVVRPPPEHPPRNLI